MNTNKPISNPNFVNIIREMKQGKQEERLFWEEISKVKFLCPIKMECRNTAKREKQKIVLGEGTAFALLGIDNNQGEHFLMAFTDWNELKKWRQNDSEKTLILTYEDYQEIIINKDSSYQGMVINPLGENIVLSRQLLANTRQNEYMIQKGESVMLGIPKEYPVDMLNKLKEHFLLEQDVDKAYLLWMVRGSESGYLLVLDTKVSPNQLFPMIGQICQPFLNEKSIDIVLTDSNFGKNAIAEQIPFFIK